jgi:hypothetical protein
MKEDEAKNIIGAWRCSLASEREVVVASRNVPELASRRLCSKETERQGYQSSVATRDASVFVRTHTRR